MKTQRSVSARSDLDQRIGVEELLNEIRSRRGRVS
jgi:hypothetical protein